MFRAPSLLPCCKNAVCTSSRILHIYIIGALLPPSNTLLPLAHFSSLPTTLLNSPRPPTTLFKLAMEVDGLGARCSLPTCRTLDYLPFRCTACNQQFCQHHHQPSTHSCSSTHSKTVPVCPLCNAPVPVPTHMTPDNAMSRHIDAGCPKRHRANPICALPSCNVRDPAATACVACRRVFCLSHCIEVNHDCTATITKRPIPQRKRFSNLLRSNTNASSTTPSTSKSSSKSPSRSTASKSATGCRVDFANVPAAPVGDRAIDIEDRIPFAVFFPAACNLPARHMFFSRKSSAGRIIDSIQKLVPQVPPAPSSSRYALYAVKRDMSRVNLLPYITPVRELSDMLGPDDFLVLETNADGLDPAWTAALQSVGNPRFALLFSNSTKTQKGSSKCVVA